MLLRFLNILLLCAVYLGLYAQEWIPYEVGNKRELFVDKYLIDKAVNIEHRLQTPIPMGPVMEFDKPWEGKFSAYVTVLYAEGLYRMYYRGIASDNRPLAEMTCYAISADGVLWSKPNLGLFEVNGTKDNNVVLLGSDLQTSHNLHVFYDGREGIPVEERYKAVGGTSSNQSRKHKGLYRYTSPDGIHWKLQDSTAMFTGYAMDSQNILTWLPDEQCYAIYLRTWTEDRPGDAKLLKGIRTVSRSTSKDFVHWTEPQPMTFGETALEDLYTNATQPYFRAPHILTALPFRFTPNSKVLSDEELIDYGLDKTMWQGVSDAVLMSSRGGTSYDRTFLESFVRPGSNAYNWAARSNMPASGIVQTGPDEMSIYVTRAYGADNVYLERLKLRLDGFASLKAGFQEGYVVTKPLVLNGNFIDLNFSTSSVGYVKVVLTDEFGKEIPGFGEQDANKMIGDKIDAQVAWSSGSSISSLRNKTVRIKFILKDADVFAFGAWE